MAQRTNRESTVRRTMVSEVVEKEPEIQKPPARGTRQQARGNRAKRQAVPTKVQNVLWGRSAGRCEYGACNKLLIGEQISGARNANKSYIAHIVGDSPEGPRG